MVVEIPSGFEKDIKRGKSPSVGLWIDGTMPFRAETTKNYAEAVHLSYLADLVDRSPMPVASSSTHVQPRYWYNPLIKSKYSIVPGLLAVVLMLVPCHAHGHRRGEGKGVGFYCQLLLKPHDQA